MISALAAVLFLAVDPAWSASFNGPAISSYLGDAAGQRGVLVAGAGGPVSGVVEASEALQAALRASDRVRLVMDASSLGDVATTADQEIVKRSNALPVDLVLVVRVFPGSPGKPPMAVGTFYDKQGTAQGAFSVEQGKALAPHAGPVVSVGVPQAALDAVQHARTPDPVDSRKQAYEHSRLTFRESPDSRGTKWALPGRGSYGQTRLGGAEFYELVGRQDLAAGYRARKGGKVAMTVLGIAGAVSGAVTGAVVGFDALFDTEYTPSSPAKKDQRTTALVAGGVTAGVGVVLIVVGALIPEHTIDGKEARGLADKYNQKLRKDYGLPEGEAKLGPMLLEGGGGVSLEVTL